MPYKTVLQIHFLYNKILNAGQREYNYVLGFFSFFKVTEANSVKIQHDIATV